MVKKIYLSFILASALLIPASIAANTEKSTQEAVKEFVKKHPKKLATAAALLAFGAFTKFGTENQHDYAFELFSGFVSLLVVHAFTDVELKGKPINCRYPLLFKSGAILGFLVLCYGSVAGFYGLVDFAATKL